MKATPVTVSAHQPRNPNRSTTSGGGLYWVAEQTTSNGRVLIAEGKTLGEAMEGLWRLVDEHNLRHSRAA